MVQTETGIQRVIDLFQKCELTEEDSLEQIVQGIFGEGISCSMSLLKKIKAAKDIYECQSCIESFDNRYDLLKHLRKKKHFYGLEKFKELRKCVIVRYINEVSEFDHDTEVKKLLKKPGLQIDQIVSEEPIFSELFTLMFKHVSSNPVNVNNGLKRTVFKLIALRVTMERFSPRSNQ
eukprot:Pgem_evm1s11290